jgi:hypothetical protein
VAGEDFKQANVFAVRMQAKRRGCSELNKNATGVGTSVAVLKLNQKIWLTASVETRPQGYRKQRPMLI